MGDFAFVVEHIDQVVENGLEQGSVNQDITTTVGQMYALVFYTNFFTPDGAIQVKIDQVSTLAIDASDNAGPYMWNQNTVFFTASLSTTNIRFEFYLPDSQTSAALDEVSVALL